MYNPLYKHCILCGSLLSREQVDERMRMICHNCGWIAYENPIPCSAALVVNAEGDILLVKRGVEPAKGKWSLPSGFIEIDETPEEACLRELKEETGLEGSILGLIGVYSQSSSRYKNVVIIGYRVEADGCPQAGSDSEDARYFSSGSLPEVAFSSHRKIIEQGLEVSVK
ncbi:MAG: NUDIX hydrolase [Candidatus Aminicenantes bacterium]|nr:NUDIX hydrolase [Candidatus Aminicenantes bacterium]